MKEHNPSIAVLSLMMFLVLLTGVLGISEENNNLHKDVDGAKVEGSSRVSEIISDTHSSEILFSAESKFKPQGSIEEARKDILSISYSFSEPDMVENGIYHVPKMPNLRNEIIPNNPVIPVETAVILLPQGGVLDGIKVTGKNEKTLADPYSIQPGGIPVVIGSDEVYPMSAQPDPAVYDSEDRYPGVQCSFASVQNLRGYQILILKLYPMQYIPAFGEVIYFENLDVTVTTFKTEKISQLYRDLPQDRVLVEELVDNPSTLDTYESTSRSKTRGGITPLSLTNSSESYDYVIITNDALAPTFQLLANQKNMSGIHTTVVTIANITSDPDYDGNDTQEKVRNFIRDAYINWSTSYVLLGGDDEIIPHRGCYGYVFSISGPEEDNDIATDLYYGGLDGNWDDDGDGIFGEKDSAQGGGGNAGEESDMYAEVYIGRAPVSSQAEAQTFVDKVIFFEGNPRPLQVLFHGEEDSSGNELDDIKDGGGGTLQAPGAETYIPPTYNITHLYESNGDTITKAIWEAEIANNSLFVNHAGHGFVNSYEIRGAGSVAYSKSEAATLVNSYYPIHLSIACYSGSFDGRKDDNTYVADYDCIAEKYITNPNGGMVAAILNSRYGWFTTGDVTAYSGELDNEFYNQLFTNFEIRIGKTLQKTKEEFVSDALTHNTYRWVVYEWNLLGDPTMQIFSEDNVTPIADAGPDNATGTDQPILLDGSNSTDDSGYIAWYNWTFGDGFSFNGSGPQNSKVPHIYTVPGVYLVTLNVSDAWGNWDNDTCNITVWDGTPPVTNLSVGDPKYRDNIFNDWNITQTTQFNLSAYDEFSGVNFTWYTIDGEYFEFTGTPFTLSGYSEGSHVISWGSEDFQGNNGTQSITVWLDESGPLTQMLIPEPRHPDSPDYGCNVTSNTLITLIGQDQPSHSSGIAFSWLTIDSEYFVGDTFNLFGYGEGSHTITYGSLDNMGNNESANTIELWVDDTEPQTELTIGLPKYPIGIDYGCNITSQTTIQLSSQDYPAHNASINISWYTIDSDYYEGSVFNLSGYAEGQHNITWGARDFVNNNETGNLITVWLDDSEPDTTLDIAFPKHPSWAVDGVNVTSQTQLTLVPQDEPFHNAGVLFSWHQIDSYYFEGTTFNLTGYFEGAHTVSWGSCDMLGNNETKVAIIWIDDSTTNTTLTIGYEKWPLAGYFGCNVTSQTNFTLNSSDNPAHNSSVLLSWFTINGKYYEGSEFILADYGLNEGLHNITWGSMDYVGNNETGNFISVFLDKMPPATILQVGEPKYRDLPIYMYNVTDETPFILNATDTYSGIAFGWYYIDGEYFVGSVFNLTGYASGQHTITYGSQDNLGYNETEKSISVILDITPPVASFNIGDPKTRSSIQDYWNITSSTLFLLSALDDYSGLDTIWYTIDGEYFEGSFFMIGSLSDGLHSITFGAWDKLGNNVTRNTTIICLDNQSPSTNLTISGIRYRLNNSDFWNLTSISFFNLTATDTHSGINYTWYTKDGQYFEGLDINLSDRSYGLHTVTWGSVDMLDNNETGNLISFFIDDINPTTTFNLGNPKHPPNPIFNITWDTPINLSATDETGCGVATIYYQILSDSVLVLDWTEYEPETLFFNLSTLGDGNYEIIFNASDRLGNMEPSNHYYLRLDNTEPITGIIVGDPKNRKTDLDYWNVTQVTTFNLISNDGSSGVSEIWYTIDGEYFEGSSFILTGYIDGLHVITWGAEDNLGNNGTAGTMIITIDTQTPNATIFIGDESPPLDGNRVQMNTSTLVSFTASDSLGVGIDYIWYSLDGGTTYHVYDSPFTVDLNTSSIIFGARDLVENNASGKTLRVDVDEPPQPPPPPPPDDNGDGNGDEPIGQDDEKPFIEQFIENFTNNILYIFLLIMVVILLLLFLRMRRGKEEEADTQVPQQDESTPFIVEEEEYVNFEEGGDNLDTFEVEEVK